MNREYQTLYSFVGIILNEAINKILKNIIKQPRPDVTQPFNTQYGM